MERKFEGGINIAIKIPKSKYQDTVAFYRDILALEVQEKPIDNPTVSKTHRVKFGNNVVWLDCVDNYTHSETWLELKTPDVDNATKYLNSKGINTCDELEKIPENMHWIMDPAGTVFILDKQQSTTDNNPKCAEAQLLIRKPVAEVFEAFIDPELTKHFWFTKGSGRLETGKTVTWEWEMYNVSTKVFVKEILPNRKIVIDWDEPVTSVDFDFKTLGDGSTYVTIRHYGFDKTGDELLEAIKDSTGGFTTVLDGLKAYLEHNINLNLAADKFPKEAVQHGQ